MITKEDFQKEIRDALKEAVAGVSEESRVDKVSALLEKADSTISELIETVELKDEELSKSEEAMAALKKEVEELTAKAKEVEERFTAREGELKEAQEKAAAAEERATKAESELTGISHDRRLELRVAELAEAKVLKAGEKLEAQKNRIRSLSDEDFAAYKEELVDLRQAVEAALQDQGDEGVNIAPPVIDKGAAAGVLNVEQTNNADRKAQMAEFGQALAKLLRNEK